MSYMYPNHWILPNDLTKLNGFFENDFLLEKLIKRVKYIKSYPNDCKENFEAILDQNLYDQGSEAWIEIIKMYLKIYDFTIDIQKEIQKQAPVIIKGK